MTYFTLTNFGGRSEKQTVKVLLNYVLSRAAVFAANATSVSEYVERSNVLFIA